MQNEIKATLLALASIAIGIISVFSEQYRILIISLSAVLITAYFLSEYINRIEKHEEDIKKLTEKLKIHEQLVNMKADIVKMI